MINHQFRQGDVLLRTAEIPSAAVLKTPNGRVVLAYGEATGHAHAIEDLDAVDVYVGQNEGMYLRAKRPVTLRHEEHAALTIPAGDYEWIIQREYEPSAPMTIRYVRD